MTADQLIAAVFVNHWLASTFFMPSVTFIYAWVTDQTGWWVCSLLLALTYAGLKAK